MFKKNTVEDAEGAEDAERKRRADRTLVRLCVCGWLTDRDGPNPGPVPYRERSQAGFYHPCGASDSYKKDGEYLLMLRTRKGALTPYWAGQGATSEQLFGPEDRWLAWVRQQLRSEK